MKRPTAQFLISFILLGISSAAFAHPGHDVSGLSAGLMHPFRGFDHLLAMVAVGLWAAKMAWKIGLLPAAFMLMMVVGAKCALIYPVLPLIESGIAASVLVLGMITALSLKFSAQLSVAITALFGFFHGYAHGLEMPGAIEAEAYALGFLAATVVLHLAGIVVGIASRARFVRLPQMLGAIIAASGLWLLSTT
ncbi:MAG: HupE/UreJ family protein [Nitrosomonadales bacterium]|nr:HupE/UreJ family protein [Nitrosomonadales bacterium]